MDREGQYLATSASLILVGSLIIPPRDLNPQAGATGGTRTHDLSVKKPMLYQLSYGGYMLVNFCQSGFQCR